MWITQSIEKSGVILNNHLKGIKGSPEGAKFLTFYNFRIYSLNLTDKVSEGGQYRFVASVLYKKEGTKIPPPEFQGFIGGYKLVWNGSDIREVPLSDDDKSDNDKWRIQREYLPTQSIYQEIVDAIKFPAGKNSFLSLMQNMRLSRIKAILSFAMLEVAQVGFSFCCTIGSIFLYPKLL